MKSTINGSTLCPACGNTGIIKTTIEGTTSSSPVSVPCPRCHPAAKRGAEYMRDIPIIRK